MADTEGVGVPRPQVDGQAAEAMAGNSPPAIRRGWPRGRRATASPGRCGRTRQEPAALTDQQQGGDDEGKGDAVVESRLAGYGVAQAIVVAGVVDLDVAGQHRVGGREDRRDQQGQPPVQAEQEMRAQGKAEDTAEQDRSGQQPGGGPGRRAQRRGAARPPMNSEISRAASARCSEPAADVRQATAPGMQPGRADGQAEQR